MVFCKVASKTCIVKSATEINIWADLRDKRRLILMHKNACIKRMTR